MSDTIKIKGAREHNLKNINVEIPKNKFVVITGVSGSGKSSLAFDTLYAEGQRRYVESLSAYARQFLGIMDKHDVDTIEGLSPAISIDQKTTSHNPRSTVGTITEIYDYLRLLFARIGHPHCPNCGREITRMSLDEIVGKIFEDIERAVAQDKIRPHRIRIIAPVVRQRKGEFKDLFSNLISKGYTQARIDKKEMPLDSEIELIKTNKHDVEIVIDEILMQFKDLKDDVFKSNLRSRLATAVEQSINLTDGLVIVDSGKEHLLSDKFSCPNCNISLPELEPRMFSFNSPLGACERCKGIGTIYKVDPELIVNKNLSINEGAILPFNKLFFQDTWYIRLLKQMGEDEDINFDMKINALPKEDLKKILYGTKKTYRVPGTNRQGRPTVIYEVFDGVVAELQRRFFESETGFEGYEIGKYIKEETCPSCEGKRLKKEILSVTIDKRNISDFTEDSIEKLLLYADALQSNLTEYEKAVGKSILKEVVIRLTFLKNVGLGYLTVGRTAKSLSGGELQRIRLASQIGTGLTGVLYVLDEPSIGLHPKDVAALIETLHNLKDLGNTLVIVEHDQETIESADYIVELGPKAGNNGGKLIHTGTVSSIKKSKHSLTGAYLSGRKRIRSEKRDLDSTKGVLSLLGARQYNLKKINLKIPLGNLVTVTGVSGSGKSTLVVETLYPALKYHIDGHYGESMGDFDRLDGFQYVDRVYLVDQSPIGRTPRSNPATYVGFFDEIREIFAQTQDARIKGFKKGRFSFNLKGGRCEKCQGGGVIKIEMQFLPDVYIKCDVCEGHRYNKETLEVKYKGKSIFEILKMTIDEAYDFFQSHFKIFHKLQFLKSVGLGYIELGQPAPTFSGGEAQRIKLANELSRKNSGRTVYILDEPTTGLHFYDVEKLLHALYQLIDKGNTVIVIEHNMDIIRNSQYVVDLGPEGGDNGGKVLYQGELQGILKEKSSHTAHFLKKNTLK
ncbi:excinuclease ABC subunit A [Candidatus Roizmanbacteria bacterium RIFCSPLOWO2_12_FULL_40_12]|nr:MAG: excinuclease ABC subunit A [Candidatus Roizmanbacteria bacterium RIFCSPLOWO2_12_FULL_40_12]